jgi:hypothetical protein
MIGILLSLEVGNTCMISPPRPRPDSKPTLIFPFFSIGMEGGGMHYPYLHSRQVLPQDLPVPYKGWTNSCLPDRTACSYKFQVGEKASSSSTPPLYQLTQTSRRIPLSVASMHRCSPVSFVATIKELEYRTLKTSVLRYDDYLNMPRHCDLMYSIQVDLARI